MGVSELLQLLGDAIDDPEEESFLLFTGPIPSSNLGFIDSKAKDIEISVNGQDLSIQQSPGLLTANLAGGTTGAVVWKVTPAFASWIADSENILTKTLVISPKSVVIELGSGVSGLVALTLGQQVAKYIATDQSYVLKILRHNIESNWPSRKRSKLSKDWTTSLEILELDWETTLTSDLPLLIPELQQAPSQAGGLDLIIACDCIYNEALIPSFVSTCADLCGLRRKFSVELESGMDAHPPTLCIIAQQLRSAVIFEEWLRVFHQKFNVWRIPDVMLSQDLKEGTGFVIHIGILR
ncbi:MAG: hypothetical protein GOMPHAMPRED_000909 [Gomphillus americanus]|uniref:Diaminohydroxyphosphoribosylamino-pyrimidine deaminase n=1 Tax=Gomphillus americanus TaxID=1940652 RepID=A0A8H3F0N5_9LECA|nr:MAG: hypothetical protein GOMPHAMPRED_000909 [Gomphillus americanus]